MLVTPRVVCVDNNKTELDQIHRALLQAGIPALPILYDAASWQETKFPSTAAVRLVFLDMNLIDGQAHNAGVITPAIAQVLERIAPRGPYVLVFWSKFVELADDVIALLRKRYSDKCVPPIRHLALSKVELHISEKETNWDKRLPELASRLMRIVDEVPVLQALVQWEARIVEASASTVARINELAGGPDKWDTSAVERRLQQLLTWIAHEAVGAKAAGEAPAEAAEQGLIYALADDLSRSMYPRVYEEVWKNALPRVGKSNFKPDQNISAAALNEVFHVDTRGVKAKDRGAFVLLTDAVIGDDERCKAVFGDGVRQLREEFLNIEAIDESALNDVLAKCELGLVELSAACDYAQRKKRSYRFALAALIPYELAKVTHFETRTVAGVFPRDKKHDAIHRLPPLRIKGKDFVCKVNFRHVLGLPLASPLLGEAIFRIRVPLLDEIAYRCSMHLARPGIIAFRDHLAGDG